MKFVYLVLDPGEKVVAVYDNKEVAELMLASLEEKVGKTLTVDRRSVNQDIKMVGLIK